MALSQKHVKDICMINGLNLQCRYLDEDSDNKGNIVHICRKLSTDKKVIDQELTDFYAEMTKKGTDPAAQGVPLGDNCQGYIALKTKQQGFDVK